MKENPDDLSAHADERLLQELRSDLEQLDHVFPVQIPDQTWLLACLKQHQRMVRKRLIRDVLLFLLVAFMMLAGLLSVLIKAPILFITLQVICLIIPPVLIVNMEWRRSQG